MCIITGPVSSVKSTKIFVAPSRSRNRQLVVYSNIVATDAMNMMVLPVPNPATVQFEEGIMYYKNLFDDAEASFNIANYEAYSYRGESALEINGTLPVVNVGSYSASIAMTVDDLNRLNTTTFNITPNLIQMLKRHYEKRGLGFICCVLRPGGNSYEPIAYTHELERAGTLFVPTKHYHKESASPPINMGPNSIYGNMWEALRSDPEYANDWDHIIYSVGTTVASAHLNSSRQYLPARKNELNWGQFPPEYQYGPAQRLCRWEKIGHYKNIDLEFDIVG